MDSDVARAMADLRAAVAAQQTLLCCAVAHSGAAVPIAEAFLKECQQFRDSHLYLPIQDEDIASRAQANADLISQLAQAIKSMAAAK